jgi:small subunit ribosomal protein S18
MPMMRRPHHVKPVARDCGFCANKTNPDYKDAGTLTRFVSERGKILGKSRTGICSHHQRMLKREIKRARFLALIPYVVRV